MGKEQNMLFVLKNPQNRTLQIGKTSKYKIKLIWNDDFAQKYTSIFERGQTFLDNQVIKAIEPYMPKDTGNMITSMQKASVAGSGKIMVQTPYARNVYYGGAINGKNGSLRGPYYFERMIADKKDYLLKITADEMGGKT